MKYLIIAILSLLLLIFAPGVFFCIVLIGVTILAGGAAIGLLVLAFRKEEYYEEDTPTTINININIKKEEG